MSKKFTMLLMLLLAFVGVAKAGVTDLPQMSTEGDIKWYTIKNARQQKFATYAGDAATMTQQASASAASFFYFTASTTEGAVKIHNYAAGEKLCAAYNSWTATGIDWYLKAQSAGVSICTSTGEWNAWNDAGGGGQKIEYWSASDAGSAWEISLVTDFSAIIDVPAAKTAAVAEIQNYAVVSTLYPAATAAVEAVNAVVAKSNGLKDLNDAIEAINAIVVGYRNAAYKALEGKYYTIKTPARGNGYMQMAASKVIGTAEVASPANIWQFVCNDDGTLKVYNPYTGKYLCEPQGNSSVVAVTAESSAAGAYILNVNANAENADAKVKFTSNSKSVHMDGSSNLVRWDNGGASEWQVVEITNFSSMITSYKTSSIATLNSWATLSVVFDAALIETAKAAINGIATTDWATFAAIDAELTKVTDAVAAKMFTFQTIATDNHRENVWVSANMSTDKAIGLHGEHNYNSIWSLRHAGGVAFYLYNELNSVYMGAPSGNCALTETPAAAYTFEIVDAENGVVEMHTNGETLHASNHNDDKLLNWDNNEDASRWYIRTIDVAADIQTLLDGLTEDDYTDVPALGQYPTAAYEALVEARTSAKTVEEVEAAIAAFEASLNRPVYFITSAWDGGYPAGSAIYYDGMNWLWKKANKFDRQMWMTIPGYTNGNVPSVDAYDKDGTHYGFYDYFTGTKMRNLDVQIVAVPSWADAYNLQYSETANNAAMHAQSDKKLVGWNPATISSNQASAWKIEYLGGSYSLSKLSPEKLEALANLQAAFDSKSYLFNATYGDGLGQYQDNGNAESIYNTLMEVATFLDSKLSLFADEGCTIEEINEMTASLNAIEVSINMPGDGKYYRIWGANNVNPRGYYITCHTNNDGGRIALTAEADASTIYYYKDGKLQAYLNGKYIATSSNHYVFDNKDHAASDITFEASNRVAGAFTIKSAGVFLHYKVYFDAVELDRCGVDEAVGHDWYLQEVTMEEINKDIVTDLNQVSDQARYKIYGERGFMYVDAANGIVKSTYSESNRVDYSPVNEYHNFAIVNIDGKFYLYSVGAKKFVVKSGNTVALVDFPEQEITIEPATDQSTDYDWLIKMGGTNLLNITNQHNSGIYTAYNTEDPGNRWALRKVGKFDPEYATTVRKVSVSYTVDGKTTTKAHAIKEGNTFSFTIPNASFSVVTSCKLGTEEMKDAEGGKFSFVVERDTALSVEIETNLPIKVAENANNIPADAWYYFVMHSNQRKYIQYLPDSTYIEWRDAAVRRDSIDTYSWALVGNVLDGFKLVNKAAKDMALLSKGSGNPSMGAYANGTAFLLDSTSTEIEGAFCLKYPNGNYLNASSGKVAHWNAADAGSTIIPALSASESLAELAALLPYAETVATIDNDKAESLTTAISAAQEVYNTSTDNAAVEAQVTALNTAIDNVIKAEVGAGLFRLKNSASGLYMTIVTPEAADGIQIKAKDSDATKQAFYIESTAEVVGVYNIKSTEGYFMASSASWNYGAYKTANEAGRAHKVEYLGEGKYALKTLLGYAGPNKDATDENSPLYSNHTADNNGREWELEELTKSSITYIYKWNDQTIESEVHENVYEGLAAPATAVTLPFGFSYDAASLPSTKGAGNQEVEIACTLSLPFQYAATYDAIETNGYWYYLKFDSNNNYYLHHADGQDHIALDSKDVNKKNKDVYSWGFVGDPINGFKIVNKAAGSTKILSSSTTMAGETGAGTWPIMTVAEGLAEGNNTYWIPTASTHATNGFFLAQKGFPNNRLNNRGKLAYWTGGAGAGSTFVVEARPFGPAAELEELLIEAEELKAVVDANTGDKIGEYSEETATALADAITTAEAVTEATADDVTALENVVLGTKINLPTAGTYYQIHSALFTETKAVYSDGNAPMWKTLNANDKTFFWQTVATDDGIALKNVADGKFLNGNAGQSGAWSVSDTPVNIDVKILTKEDANGYQYGVILNNWQMHANGHNDGEGASGSIVSWNAEAGSASAWYMVEVDALPEFYTIEYNFQYNGITKFTQTATLAEGAEFPEFTVELPYGVSITGERPTGTVAGNQTFEVKLEIEKALPFVAAADVKGIDKWYYVQMNVYNSSLKYLQDCDSYVEWADTSVDDTELDAHLWGFVGDLWNGFQVVNKGTKKAIVSTNEGDASMGETGTIFMLTSSDNTDNADYFCLRHASGNYLNAQGDRINHWHDNDDVSTIFVTEYNKDYEVSVSEVGYSTYYSDYRLAIPETVEAYVVASVENREVVLEQVTGVIPAHTGIILRGKGTHNFVTSAAATTEIEANLLKGTTTKTLITPADGYTCYVLANPKDGNGVGLYRASLNQNDGKSFYNNANKVYLPVANPVVEDNDGQAARALRFRFGGEGTTEIEPSTLNSQPSTIIYDLTGRRINEIVEKGIYIVNGKKVVIR